MGLTAEQQQQQQQQQQQHHSTQLQTVVEPVSPLEAAGGIDGRIFDIDARVAAAKAVCDDSEAVLRKAAMARATVASTQSASNVADATAARKRSWGHSGNGWNSSWWQSTSDWDSQWKKNTRWDR